MPTIRHRPLTFSFGLLAISGVIAGCGGSSSGGGSAPSPTATVNPRTHIGQLSVLREPMSSAKAKAASPKLKSLPGVVQVRYAQKTHELLVYLSGKTTVQQRQRVVEAIAKAANGK